MGIFYKIKSALARFMYGRNGVDQLGLSMVWGCLLLLLVSSLVTRRQAVIGTVLYWISIVFWAGALFRIFSKNLYKRREENSRWLNRIWRFKSRFQGARERHADKTHKYYTCKACKTICRVPVGKGKIVITCPKCGAQIHAKT
ncbi:hypothetical protein SAMN05216343_1285 [Oscillibacter sp. PC13]|uniref:hypothetical protein n=1 Tax=Oscillibacter sp. PC13 TaxID=1855299 RepID=UPI0008E3CA3D|nr:hypothetical protein [Oscillibacter sp. PC13]SFQ16743.1 hypothetical protein SAMN05216343_1285 [Oscillibacter sp. PC13]